jgi:hypothetical protein
MNEEPLHPIAENMQAFGKVDSDPKIAEYTNRVLANLKKSGTEISAITDNQIEAVIQREQLPSQSFIDAVTKRIMGVRDLVVPDVALLTDETLDQNKIKKYTTAIENVILKLGNPADKNIPQENIPEIADRLRAIVTHAKLHGVSGDDLEPILAKYGVGRKKPS